MDLNGIPMKTVEYPSIILNFSSSWVISECSFIPHMEIATVTPWRKSVSYFRSEPWKALSYTYVRDHLGMKLRPYVRGAPVEWASPKRF